jgi:hypothetical protein
MADIVIINPRFDTSFWGMEHCVGLFGKRANLPVACLALLAALVPNHHRVTLIDENVDDIDFDRLGRADLVCLTGMCIQARRMSEILREVNSRGVMTVVGGPLATVEEETLEGLADVVFIGEADETWPQFLRDWEQGCHRARYEQREKTDVTKLPLGFCHLRAPIAARRRSDTQVAISKAACACSAGPLEQPAYVVRLCDEDRLSLSLCPIDP